MPHGDPLPGHACPACGETLVEEAKDNAQGYKVTRAVCENTVICAELQSVTKPAKVAFKSPWRLRR